MQADLSPAADALQALLKDPSPQAAQALIARLPQLLPQDPEMAAILEEELAAAFGDEVSRSPEASKPRGVETANSREVEASATPAITQEAAQALFDELMAKGTVVNKEGECQAKDPANCPYHGTGKYAEAESEQKAYKAPTKITAEEGRDIITRRTEVEDPKGQRVRFGERLEIHLNGKPIDEQNRRLEKMAYALDAVQTTEPIIHPRGMTDRNVYIKATSDKTCIMVFVDNKGDVQEVFDVFSKNLKDVMESIGK